MFYYSIRMMLIIGIMLNLKWTKTANVMEFFLKKNFLLFYRKKYKYTNRFNRSWIIISISSDCALSKACHVVFGPKMFAHIKLCQKSTLAHSLLHMTAVISFLIFNLFEKTPMLSPMWSLFCHLKWTLHMPQRIYLLC